MDVGLPDKPLSSHGLLDLGQVFKNTEKLRRFIELKKIWLRHNALKITLIIGTRR